MRSLSSHFSQMCHQLSPVLDTNRVILRPTLLSPFPFLPFNRFDINECRHGF